MTKRRRLTLLAAPPAALAVLLWLVWRPKPVIEEIQIIRVDNRIESGFSYPIRAIVKCAPAGASYFFTSQKNATIQCVNTTSPECLYTASAPGPDEITVELRKEGAVLTRSAKPLAITVLPQGCCFRYGWDAERAGVVGWVPFEYDKAPPSALRLLRPSKTHREGGGALELVMRFDSGHRIAEAAVNLILHPPDATNPRDTGMPRNLSGMKLRAFVHCERSLPVHRDHPPGMQLFVQDTGYRALYGCYQSMEPGAIMDGKWMQVAMRLPVSPAVPAPCEGSTPPEGFRADTIKLVGVKIGSDSESPLVFQGSCFVDSLTVGPADENPN